MKKLSKSEWQSMSAAQKADVYERLAEQTLPGYSRDVYLDYAVKFRQQAETARVAKNAD